MSNNETPVRVAFSSKVRPGQPMRVSTLLPTRARDLDVDAFSNFQQHHKGSVQVEGRSNGVHLTRVLTVIEEGAEATAQLFAETITKYFGFYAEPIPTA